MDWSHSNRNVFQLREGKKRGSRGITYQITGEQYVSGGGEREKSDATENPAHKPFPFGIARVVSVPIGHLLACGHTDEREIGINETGEGEEGERLS